MRYLLLGLTLLLGACVGDPIDECYTPEGEYAVTWTATHGSCDESIYSAAEGEWTVAFDGGECGEFLIRDEGNPDPFCSIIFETTAYTDDEGIMDGTGLLVVACPGVSCVHEFIGLFE